MTSSKDFLSTLVPMRGHGDKRAINANYRKILKEGFRYCRQWHAYVHPDGRAIRISPIDKNGFMHWIECYTK